jgi:hypothetical protein
MNYNDYSGISPELRSILGTVGAKLPFIRGKWFVVDPYQATYVMGAEAPGTIYTTLLDAYDACTSGNGDGILVMSGGTGTASQTSSYLSSVLAWSKHGITVVGLSAPTRFAQRARISNKQITTGVDVITIAFPTATTITDSASGFLTAGFKVGDIIRIAGTGSGTNDGTGHIITAVTAGTITCAASTFSVVNAATTGSCTITTYCSDLIVVSGSNNSFYNLHFSNTDSDALALGAVKVTGSRNYFENCHIGVGVADANSTITHSLWLSAAAENTFVNCVVGLDTVDRGGVATYDILLSGAVARNRFYGCETVRQSGTGTGCLAVYASATTGGRPTMFVNCIFTVWNTAGGNANCSFMFGSTGACDFVWFVDCSYPGYAALSNDAVAWSSGEVNSQAAGLMYT